MRIWVLVGLLIAAAGPALADFNISITSWGNIPSCTNGRPNTVGNPVIVLRDIPQGTTRIDFQMVDLNAPNFDHGGGRVQIGGGSSGTIPAGTFRYRSPCPPDGAHTYEWRAVARDGRTILATASARLRYPN